MCGMDRSLGGVSRPVLSSSRRFAVVAGSMVAMSPVSSSFVWAMIVGSGPCAC